MKLKVIGGICLLLFALIYSCQSDSDIEFRQYYTAGNLVYHDHCQNCHGAKAEGLASLIPPLTDTTAIKLYKITLPCIVQYGLNIPVKIGNKTFTGQMPAVSLSPMEVAQVVTYVTNSFGNKLGVTAVDDVYLDLKKCGVQAP